ncbi:MAG TPA: Gfo/Idh/MocA family oxidoreductase [Tepidisphaeraceae bacterium]|jgi:predicted dehydrogenase
MQIRWGILGTGNIARQFANGVKSSRACVLTAVASRTAATAEAFGAQYGIARAYNDYGTMLADPTVDAVYVSLPNTMHHEWTIKALRAGKHVLCEKPLATSSAQAEEMFAIAQQTGRVLIEAFMYRCHPQTLAVVDAVRRGAIGTPRLVRTSFCYRTTKIKDNIRFNPALAGGALMDVGCYCLSFSRLIAGGEPTAAQAVGVRQHGVDVAVSGSLKFEKDLTASFTCAMNTQSDNAALICGDEGWIRVSVPWKPTGVSSGYTIERQTPPRQDNSGRGPLPLETIVVPASGDVYGIEADAFAAVIGGTAVPFVTPADSLGNMRLLERLQASLIC